jgi:transposase
LPLDLEVKLLENDIAFSIYHLVKSIPNEAFEFFLKEEGCPAYHPRIMFKFFCVDTLNLPFQVVKSKPF